MKLFLLQIIFVAQPIKFCPCNVLPQLRVQICADHLRMRCDPAWTPAWTSFGEVVKGQSNNWLHDVDTRGNAKSFKFSQ